jgi:hypothetical protein
LEEDTDDYALHKKDGYVCYYKNIRKDETASTEGDEKVNLVDTYFWY